MASMVKLKPDLFFKLVGVSGPCHNLENGYDKFKGFSWEDWSAWRQDLSVLNSNFKRSPIDLPDWHRFFSSLNQVDRSPFMANPWTVLLPIRDFRFNGSSLLMHVTNPTFPAPRSPWMTCSLTLSVACQVCSSLVPTMMFHFPANKVKASSRVHSAYARHVSSSLAMRTSLPFSTCLSPNLIQLTCPSSPFPITSFPFPLPLPPSHSLLLWRQTCRLNQFWFAFLHSINATLTTVKLRLHSYLGLASFGLNHSQRCL